MRFCCGGIARFTRVLFELPCYLQFEQEMNDWMTDDILVLKALRRKYELLWRKTRLTVHFDMYSESSMAVKKNN